MTILKFLRKMFRTKHGAKHALEYIEETPAAPSPVNFQPEVVALPKEPEMVPTVRESTDEVAFSPQGDLEAYVQGLTVPREVIERWIAAGVLLPEEIRVAEKMIRIMRKKEHTPIH